jgi:hypothetical protein
MLQEGGYFRYGYPDPGTCKIGNEGYQEIFGGCQTEKKN